MTPQTQQQLITELEKLREEAENEEINATSEENMWYYTGKNNGIAISMQLIRNTEINRSSQEPKVKE